MIIVDGEDLRRVSRHLAAAAADLARLAVTAHGAAVTPAVTLGAALDPYGAARAAGALLVALDGPHGLVALAAAVELDALRVTAARLRYEVVDGGPWPELVDLGAALALVITSPDQWAHAPAAVEAAAHAAGAAVLGWMAPAFDEVAPLVALGLSSPALLLLQLGLAPAALRPLVLRGAVGRLQFVGEIVTGAPLTHEPTTGLPLQRLGALTSEGPGAAAPARLAESPPAARQAWPGLANRPLGDLSGSLRRVAALAALGSGHIAIERIAGPRGSVRWVVELPGIASRRATQHPQDLPGAFAAATTSRAAYARAVATALDRAGVPRGAEVMLVGHSQGGIVAMQMAADTGLNGSRVRVTHVVAAGAPVTRVAVPAGTRVLTLDNIHDIVPQLDVADARDAAGSPGRVDVSFSAPEVRTVVGNHACSLYADELARLYDSPDPRVRGFLDSARVFTDGPTSTSTWMLTDRPPSTADTQGRATSGAAALRLGSRPALDSLQAQGHREEQDGQ